MQHSCPFDTKYLCWDYNAVTVDVDNDTSGGDVAEIM